jgi:predicted ATP-grasp superfamily ATP-dependent carboligase
MKKKVLVISLGWEQAPLIKILLKRKDVELYGIHYPGYIDSWEGFTSILQLDYRDLKSVSKYVESIKPDAIISDEDDYGMFLQAYYSEKYNLPGPKIHQAQIACNKYLQRSVAKSEKISIPEFSLCKSISDVENFTHSFSFPIIIKPIDSRGSIGVTKINRKEEIPQAFYRALENSPSLLTIVEEYIEGDHYNVDGFCFQNDIGIRALAVSENIKLADDQGTVNDEIVYGNLKYEIEDELKLEAEKIAFKFGLNFGFFHGEFIKSKNNGKIYLTEMANRGGGILISELVLPFVTDIPLLNLLIADCLGETTDVLSSAPKKNYARIDFVSLEPGKKYRKIEISENEKTLNEFINIISFLQEGDIIPNVEDGSKRHIMIVSNIQDKGRLEFLKESIKNKAQV